MLSRGYRDLVTALERVSGKAISVDSLEAGIETVNKKRAAMHRLAKLRHANPAPISGLDALLANQVFFYDAPERFTGNVDKLCDELEQRIENKTGVAPDKTPRIVISGCPMAVPNRRDSRADRSGGPMSSAVMAFPCVSSII
ncbi:MAG: 2-hydroxyacyl-CoA dehydratase family protein [Polyangia bacterium]